MMENCTVAIVKTLVLLGIVVATSGEWTTGTYVTGYWDCCKPSCAWPNKGNVNQPVRMCDANSGSTLWDPNAASVCGGGQAASCTNQQPWIVKDGLSMGFAAAAVGGTHGLSGDANCGQCFELQFVDRVHDPWSWGGWGGSHPELVGKTIVIQVTNIGYDVNGEHSFDLQIPGAGQGAFTDGCSRQFPGYPSNEFDCDLNYGGCTDISGCSRLPPALQAGCEWRFTWLKWLISNGQTNNPYVRFRRVQCPTELTDFTGTIPLDDHQYPVHTGRTNQSRTTTGFLSRSSATTTRITISCSDDQADCRETKCCVGSAMRCYKKDEYWAACLSSCSPGQVRQEDPPQYRTPWSCDVLGTLPTTTTPTPTSAPLVTTTPTVTTTIPTTTTRSTVTTAVSTVMTTVAVTSTLKQCAGTGVDCRSSACCQNSAMQCYEKNEWWAQCFQSCTPGIRWHDPPQHRTPWSCNIIGATCVHASTDCRSSGCCKDPNMRCYEKNEWWGECAESCTPGINYNDPPQYQTPWSCRSLSTEPMTTQTPALSFCADADMDCRSSQCCKDSEMKCYRKNEHWSACLSSCSPGQVRSEDPPQFRTPWNCNVLSTSMASNR